MDKAIAKAISVIIVVFGAAPESVEAWHSAGAHALAANARFVVLAALLLEMIGPLRIADRPKNQITRSA